MIRSHRKHHIFKLFFFLVSLHLIYLPTLKAETLDLSITLTSPSATPDSVVRGALSSMCPDITAGNQPESSSLTQVCDYIQTTATPDEIDIIAKELSAKPNTSAGITSPRLTPRGNLSGIGVRLLALRRASKRISDFAFNAAIGQEEPGGLLSQRLSSFLNVRNLSSERKESSTEIGSNMSSSGLLFGMDYRLISGPFVGVAAQYDQVSADLTDSGSKLDANQWGVILYSTHFIKPRWYIEGTLTNNRQKFDLRRQIDLSLGQNSINTFAKSNTNANQRGWYVGTGYEQPLKSGFNSVASFGLSYISSKHNAYTESNAGDLSLEIDSQNASSLASIANVSVSKVISSKYGVLFPQFSMNWIHETNTKAQRIAAKFVNDTSDSEFVFNARNPDPNYFVFGLDVQLLLPKGRMAFIQYSNVQRLRDTSEFSILAGFRMEL